ncbi:hypothetical protein LDENG_00244280 [Lucifuga dentata]|nr:hypothetical protein LDENG_00244280 [Lucifuga dentata]
MAATFSLRRAEIIHNEPTVSVIQTRWPALFTERQICEEFTRTVTTDLKMSFMDGLDLFVPRLLQLYRTTTKSRIPGLKDYINCLENEVRNVSVLWLVLYY